MYKFIGTLLLAGASLPFLLAPSYAVEVRDPQGLLLQADRVMAGSSFADSFRDGDQAEIRLFSKDCQYVCSEDPTGSSCGAICETVDEIINRTVMGVTAEEASWVDSDGAMYALRREDFDRRNGNLLHSELDQVALHIGLAGHIELIGLEPLTYAYRSGRTTSAHRLRAIYRVGSAEIDFEITFRRSSAGVGQILMLRVLGDKIFRIFEATER